MYNSDHKAHRYTPASPRISFSNDFVDSQQAIKQERSPRSEPPASSDFEFSVTNYSMMSADELFFKGKLLPFKETCSSNQMPRTTTLREELLVEDDEEDDSTSVRPAKGRWKGFLGLKKNQIGSKRAERSDVSMEIRIGECKRSGIVHEEAHVNKTPQVSQRYKI